MKKIKKKISSVVKLSDNITLAASWDPDKGSGGFPQLKSTIFQLKSLDMHNYFTATANIGSGGYGMVYRGSLPNGHSIAIKRSQQGSTRMLSVLLVSVLIKYLHDLADPPIIHRDVKTTNILLDERLNAKVADFGLSKPLGDSGRTHVTTQVKGTMGYMDPEYYMTQQLTEKSDVYGFGIVMLELITARNPIEKGKYIVREVKEAMDKEKVLYHLHEVLDPIIGLSSELQGMERFVDVALRCVEETGIQRPRMSEVVKERGYHGIGRFESKC
ncbi:probable leucine-rich repeat receptor-like protein kinase [Tanacetum coccineum]